MSQVKQTTKDYLMSLTVLHAAFIVGQLIFCGVAYYLVSIDTFGEDFQEFASILQFIVPVVVLMSIFVSSFVLKNRLPSIQQKTTLSAKLIDYRTYFISKLALLEGAALFSIVSYMLTGGILFLALAGLVILVFLTHRPSKESIIQDLLLNHQERVMLDNAEYILN